MKTVTLLITVAANALCAAAPAVAQSSQPDTKPKSVEAMPASEEGLADIIVTAQRRSESSQRAAVPVDVITPRALTAAGVVTAATLNAVVPSLAVQQSGSANTTYFIRGVGNYTNNGYSDPAIAFNLDGVYLGRPTSTTGAFFDLDRIEVLKGPQGTLYGRNATGGAINVIPTKPKLDETSASAAGSYGNYRAFDLEAAVNVALGPDLALRLAGKLVDRHGYNDDGTSDDVGQAVRAQLLYRPSPGVSLRIAGDYSHQGGLGVGYNYIGNDHFTPGSPATATSPANYTFVPTPSTLGPYTGLLSPAARAYFATTLIAGPFIFPAPLDTPYQNNSYWGVTGEATIETGIGTLSLIPAYRHSNIDNIFNGPSFRRMSPLEKDDQFSLEARLQGNRIGPIEWLAGLYYFDEKVNGLYSFNQYLITAFQDFTSKTKSYAAFGRVTAHASGQLRLVVGGRYTKDEKSFDGSAQTLAEICPSFPPQPCLGGPSLPLIQTLAEFRGGPTVPFVPVPYGTAGNLVLFIPNTVKASINKGRLTYRAAAEFDVAPRSLLYASFETGYRSGGFSLAPGYETFAPEYVDAFTLGSKNRFFDNKIQLNIEAFYWKYRDQQVSHFGIDSNGSLNFFTQNLGRSTVKGIETDFEWLVTPTTQLSGTVAYLDSKANRFVFTNPGAGNPPPVSGCAVTGDAPVPITYTIDCSGKQAYNSPRWSLNAGIDQTIPLGENKVLLSGQTRYRSNSIIGFEYIPQDNSGSHWNFDASVSFGATDDRWSLTAFVRNITDEVVPTYVQYSGGSGVVASTFAPPRTYGMRGAVKF